MSNFELFFLVLIALLGISHLTVYIMHLMNQDSLIKILKMVIVRGVPVNVKMIVPEDPIKEADGKIDNLLTIVTKIVQEETSKHPKCGICSDNRQEVGELLVHLQTDHGYIVDEKLSKEIDKWIKMAKKAPVKGLK